MHNKYQYLDYFNFLHSHAYSSHRPGFDLSGPCRALRSGETCPGRYSPATSSSHPAFRERDVLGKLCSLPSFFLSRARSLIIASVRSKSPTGGELQCSRSCMLHAAHASSALISWGAGEVKQPQRHRLGRSDVMSEVFGGQCCIA